MTGMHDLGARPPRLRGPCSRFSRPPGFLLFLPFLGARRGVDGDLLGGLHDAGDVRGLRRGLGGLGHLLVALALLGLLLGLLLAALELLLVARLLRLALGLLALALLLGLRLAARLVLGARRGLRRARAPPARRRAVRPPRRRLWRPLRRRAWPARPRRGARSSSSACLALGDLGPERPCGSCPRRPRRAWRRGSWPGSSWLGCARAAPADVMPNSLASSCTRILGTCSSPSSVYERAA